MKRKDIEFKPTMAITVTYGDQAENHHGMQVLGTSMPAGLQPLEMQSIATILTKMGFVCRLIDLAEGKSELPAASVLVIKHGVAKIIGDSADAMYVEQASLPHDRKAFMHGRVVEKRARHNLCFADVAQSPNYEEGRGTVISWSDVPLTDRIRQFFARLHPKFANLVAEGNYYYNPKVCGIGFHGDTERRIVVAVRLGVAIPLVYQWYQFGAPVSPRIAIPLGHGDIYIMSEEAVGWRWKKSREPTLLHAAGAPKYIGGPLPL